jgi:hypothetical protein
VSHPADVTISELERAITRAVNGGGSGWGNSFYATAAECGRKARLQQEKRHLYTNLDAPIPFEKHRLLVGGVYHALQELWRKGYEIRENLTHNENMLEGQRLFDGWVRYWNKDFWGEQLSVEEVIPSSDEVREAVKYAFYGNPYTGKPDLVVRIRAEDLPRVQQRVPQLTQPGVYLVDFKTRDTHGSHDGYVHGLQALTYPALYNLQHPDDPCSGIIWDIIIKNGRRKVVKPIVRDDFDAAFVSTVLSHRDVHAVLSEVCGMVMMGMSNYERDIPNRSACCDYQGNLCTFRKSGQCDAIWKRPDDPSRRPP